MNRRYVWIAALVCVASLGWRSPALASPEATQAPVDTAPKMTKQVGDRRRIVGILDVRIDGVPKEIADRFQADLEKQLDSSAYWLAPHSRMLQMLANSSKWTDGCVVGKCLDEVRTQTGAEVVLLAAITGSGTSFGYVVTLVRTDTGRMLSQQADRCDVCTVNEALTSATLAAVHLLTELPDELPNEAAMMRAAIAKISATHEDKLETATRRHRRVAIVTTLAGLAIAGAGSALFYAQDHPTYALATAVGGAGLMIGGVFALNF